MCQYQTGTENTLLSHGHVLLYVSLDICHSTFDCLALTDSPCWEMADYSIRVNSMFLIRTYSRWGIYFDADRRMEVYLTICLICHAIIGCLI